MTVKTTPTFTHSRTLALGAILLSFGALLYAFSSTSETIVATPDRGNATPTAVHTMNQRPRKNVISSATANGTSGKGRHDAKSIFPGSLAVSTVNFDCGVFGFGSIAHLNISHYSDDSGIACCWSAIALSDRTSACKVFTCSSNCWFDSIKETAWLLK